MRGKSRECEQIISNLKVPFQCVSVPNEVFALPNKSGNILGMIVNDGGGYISPSPNRGGRLKEAVLGFAPVL